MKLKHRYKNNYFSKNMFDDLDSEYYNLDNWIKDGKLTYENK
jgi:hypothetical protein